MARITEVYMLVNGIQTRFSMDEFLKMRGNDPRIRALKFIPIDHRMYESTPEQFREWRQEYDRKRYLKAAVPKYTEVSYDAFLTKDGTPACECIPDEATNIAEEVTAAEMLKALRSALTILSTEERQLIQAIYFDGMTERVYSEESGIPQKTINDRKQLILRKLTKMLNSKK